MATIIIPCHNVARQLANPGLIRYLSRNSETNLIFIDDGSTDATVDLLYTMKEHNPEQVDWLSMGESMGRGEAIRVGAHYALTRDRETEHLGIWYPESGIPLTEISRVFEKVKTTDGIELLCGYTPPRRRAMSCHASHRLFAKKLAALMGLSLHDWFCSVKVFSRLLAMEIFREPFYTTILVDVEMIARTIGWAGKNWGSEVIREYSMQTSDTPATGVPGISQLPHAAYEFLLLKHLYRQELSLHESSVKHNWLLRFSPPVFSNQ